MESFPLNLIFQMVFIFFYSFISSSVVHQFYQTRVIDEFVLRGNSAILKCAVPSFVADFIEVESWVDEEGMEIFKPTKDDNLGNKFFQNFADLCCQKHPFILSNPGAHIKKFP